jgi:hypothetical protein
MYKIRSLKGVKPEAARLYLLDANVWQFILTSPYDLQPYEKVYIDFFDRLIDFSSNPKGAEPPLIYLNGLIISEVYNAYMRSKWDAYCHNGSTNDYQKYSENIQTDFEAYSNAFAVESDLFKDPLAILSNLPKKTDYNDYYYSELALVKNLIIVTNDRDFAYPNIEILTNNNKLLSIK